MQEWMEPELWNHSALFDVAVGGLNIFKKCNGTYWAFANAKSPKINKMLDIFIILAHFCHHIMSTLNCS